jgi:opacity protein-like surface antigen
MKKLMMMVAALAVCGAVSARAQDALMNSAETINPGNFKFAAYPIFTLGDGSDTGIGGRAGYGFGRGFDVEAKLSKFDGLTYYGLDAEWWLHRKSPDFSFAVGVHRTDLAGDFKIMGVDTTFLVSDHVARNLEVYGGLRIAFEFPDGPGDNYRRLNLVPGIEYRVSRDLDFLAELGLKLNDNSTSYVAVGLAYYIR